MMPRTILMTIGQFTGIFSRHLNGKYIRRGLFNITLATIGALIGAWLLGSIDYLGTSGVADSSEGDVLVDVIGSASLYIIFQALTRSTD